MKILLTLTLVCFSLPCFARIGESVPQCQVRYGTPVKSDLEKQKYYFKKDGFIILAIFREGLCASITFGKEKMDASNRRVDLSDEEIDALCEANGGAHKWKKLPAVSLYKSYVTEDESLRAGYGFANHLLVIMTKAEAERGEAPAAQAVAEDKPAATTSGKTKLKGF